MAQLDINQTTTTEMNSNVSNYSVSSKSLDFAEDTQEETFWDYPDANTNISYYKTIPELKKAIDALAMWTAGKGYTADDLTRIRLEKITGWGEDSFQSILMGLIVVKKVVGDAFAEIIRSDDGRLINLKPISPTRMRVVVGRNGLIKRYEHYSGKGWKSINKENMLHLCNDRFADEIHGTSVIDACKGIIDARNEAMSDRRTIMHRMLALGYLELDTDDETQINAAIVKYQKAVNKGEVLVLPKGVAELKPGNLQIQDSLPWIQYLEDFFYQAVGIPKIILGGSDQISEGSNKMSSYNFEQVYITEQTELEADLWNQLAIKIKLNRPQSLSDNMQSNEAKNTSQTNFQNKDFAITGGRE